MPPKQDKQEMYTFNQIKEIMGKNEETMMKFFNMTVEKLERKIDLLQEENTLLKHEVKEIKTAMDFQNTKFEEGKLEMRKMIKDFEENGL